MSTSNGADVSHFRVPVLPPVPADLAAVVARGNPVIGYFGALAKWFDYELVRRVAAERPAGIEGAEAAVAVPAAPAGSTSLDEAS